MADNGRPPDVGKAGGSALFEKGGSGRITPSAARCRPISGFTLLELLVSMALVALVTLIATVAFHLAIQAWERGAAEGDSRQVQSALPALLEKQLSSLITVPILGQANVNSTLYFCGGGNDLSFLTSYAPQGSEIQGVQWVRYEYDAGSHQLRIFQQPVTRVDDLPVSESGLGAQSAVPQRLVSQIQNISKFSLAYTVEPLYDPDQPNQWQNSWPCGAESNGVPVGLMLDLTVGEVPKAQDNRWIYHINASLGTTVAGGNQATTPFGGGQSATPFGGGPKISRP